MVSANCEGTTKFYDTSEDKQSCSGGYEYPAHVTNGAVNERFSALVNITEPLSKCLDSSYTLDGDRTLVDVDQTIIENGSNLQSKSPHLLSYDADASRAKLAKPPPLPPKPKNLVVNVVKSGYIMTPKTLQRPNHVIE